MRVSASVGKPGTDLTEQEKKEQQRYRDLALEYLQQAVKSGFNDGERLRKDRAFEPVREREDFQKLASGLLTQE